MLIDDETPTSPKGAPPRRPGQTLVVVGAGHLKGIAAPQRDRCIGGPCLDVLPQPTALGRSIPWLIPLAVFGVVAWNVINGSIEALIVAVWTPMRCSQRLVACWLAGTLWLCPGALASPILAEPDARRSWFAGYVQLRVVE